MGKFLYDYLYTVFWGWYGILVVVFGLLDFCERAFGWKVIIPLRLKMAVLLLVFIIAQVFAYKDLKEKYETSPPKIEYKDKIVHQDKPETLNEITRLKNELENKTQENKELKSEVLQLRDSRELQRLGLRPNVSLSFSLNEKGSGYSFHNHGPGAALIKWFSVKVDGVLQPNWSAVVKSLGLSNVTYDFQMIYDDKQEPSGSEKVLFWVSQPEVSKLLIKNKSRIRLEICYCSVYGECWFDSDRLRETKKSSCKDTPSILFRMPPIH